MTGSATRFKHIVILVNPASTNHARADRRINDLRRLYHQSQLTLIKTVAGKQSASLDRLAKHADKLGNNSLLCIAAGDGTTTSVIEALLYDKRFDSVRQTVILPLWGGHANDLAHMLNGQDRIQTERLLRTGNISPVYPMECLLTLPNGQLQRRIAACYVSFGATAFAAHRLNQPTHRASQLRKLPGGSRLQAIITVIAALTEAPSFAMRDRRQAGLTYERTFANGSRFAGINRLPVRLSDKKFYDNMLQPNQPLTSLRRLLRSLRRRLADPYLRDQSRFDLEAETWAQFDGEAIRLPAGTRVVVRMYDHPFYAWSTLLPGNSALLTR